MSAKRLVGETLRRRIVHNPRYEALVKYSSYYDSVFTQDSSEIPTKKKHFHAWHDPTSVKPLTVKINEVKLFIIDLCK